MDMETKEFLTGFETRIFERFAEQDRRIDEKFAEQDRKIDEKFAEQDRKIDEKFAEQDRRIDEKFAEQDRRIREQERNIQYAFKQLIHDIATEFQNVTDLINTKSKANYQKIQKDIDHMDSKMNQQTKKLSKGFKQIANDIDSKVAI